MKKLFILIIYCFSFFLISFGQENGQFIYQNKNLDLPFTIMQYATKHGLPQNQVLSLLKLPNDKIAISTANGITQFDGKNFTNLTEDKIHRNTIFSDLYYSKKDGKVFGLKFGGHFFQVSPKVRKISDAIHVTQYKNQFFGIYQDGSIYSIDGTTFKTEKIVKTSIIEPQEICIAYPKIYVCGKNGLIEFDLQSKKQKFLHYQFIHRLKLSNSGLLIMSHRELFIKNKANEKIKTLYKSNLADISFLDVAEITNEEYFIASNQGLIHLKNGQDVFYQKKDGLPSEFLHSILYLKDEKALAVGTGQQGLLMLNFKFAKNIFKPENFILNSLNSVVEFENDVLVSTANGNIFKIKKDKAELYAHFFSNFASCSSINDTLALGTWGAGIILFKNKKKVKIVTKGLKNLNIHAIFLDSKKRIWVGTDSSISIGNNFSTIKHLKKTKGKVICFYELKNKSICVGTSEGFYLIDKNLKTLRFISRKYGNFGKEIRSFYEDFEGKIWIGTYNGGMFCYHKNKLTSINAKKHCNLPEDIFCFAKDKRDNLYFTGNLGLASVNFKMLNDFYYNKIDYLIPFYYGEKSGIYNTEFNGGFQNNFLKKNNVFYFPSIEGITIFKPREMSDARTKIAFQNLYINDSLSDFKISKFATETYSLSVDFIKINFNPSNQVFYQYKLLKNDEKQDWSPLQKTNSISLKSLSPGVYTLKIRALDSFMNHHDEEISYQFEIDAPFYQTWMFYALFGLILLLIGGLFVKFRMNKHDKKIEFNNKINNQILELKLSAIQARMNPHFLFNSLNSIKYYLLVEDKEKAENLIDNFSKLLRKFLQYSDLQFIKIEDEIELLNLYLSIEKSRFNDSFTFEFNIEEKLKNEYIPTLLIQPFIENSIKHGFSDIKENMNISVRIYSEGDFVLIEIKDNGIGFDKMENKNKSSHQSKGIKLVEDKIQNLKDKYGIFVNLNIKSEQNIGTLVNLKILNDYHELRNYRR